MREFSSDFFVSFGKRAPVGELRRLNESGQFVSASKIPIQAEMSQGERRAFCPLNVLIFRFFLFFCSGGFLFLKKGVKIVEISNFNPFL